MAVSQTLSVTEVSGSVNTSANTSQVRILWKSTQSGDSWNGYTRTAKYYVSINGGAEKEYSVNYTLPKGTTVTILETTLTVSHNSDGSGSVRVRTWMDTSISAGVVEKSQSLNLTTIPRASYISSALDRTLGTACAVTWTPLSKSFRYKLKFSIGDWEYTTLAIYPNTTSPFTYTEYILSLDVANKIPKTTGTMTVSLFTYSDSNASVQVGASSPTTFTVTVPDNEYTKPSVTMSLTPVSSLGGIFSSIYIQGKSRVEATISGNGNYGASITSYELFVDGVSNGTLLSGYLSKPDNITVKGRVYDSRGYYNDTEQVITVIPYRNPTLLPASGESSIICARCDADGNLTESGNHLNIMAQRSYSKVLSDGTQKNFCQIRYRYKTEGGSYSSWVTILAGNALSSDEVITGALLDGALAIDTTYIVQVQAVDDINETATVTITVPTEKVYLHKAGSINSLGIGKYAEDPNTVDVAEEIDVKVRGALLCAEIPSNTDLNSITKPNRYGGNESSLYTNCPTSDSTTFSLEVISLGAFGQVLQRFTACSTEATTYERQFFAGQWHEWECVNPPMHVGVEYRTKERYLGKAVYTKLVDLGYLPNTSRKLIEHGARGVKIIRCVGQTSSGNSLPFHYDNLSNWIEIYAGGTYIVVNTGNDQSSDTAYGQIWYVKN